MIFYFISEDIWGFFLAVSVAIIFFIDLHIDLVRAAQSIHSSCKERVQVALPHRPPFSVGVTKMNWDPLTNIMRIRSQHEKHGCPLISDNGRSVCLFIAIVCFIAYISLLQSIIYNIFKKQLSCKKDKKGKKSFPSGIFFLQFSCRFNVCFVVFDLFLNPFNRAGEEIHCSLTNLLFFAPPSGPKHRLPPSPPPRLFMLLPQRCRLNPLPLFPVTWCWK